MTAAQRRPRKPTKNAERSAKAKQRHTKHRRRQSASKRRWLSIHARVVRFAQPLTLAGGSLIVAIWTVIRHITNGVNFDVVGQIGLAQQWTDGLHTSAELGTTNYLLKIPIYMLVNQLHFLSQMNRVLLVALLFNIATFLLLFWLFSKIMAITAPRIKNRAWLYLGSVWLATIAGSVFWVDYANSRNLETVGGILYLYFALKYLQTKKPTVLIWLCLTGSLVFFADALQFYVCGLGVCIYALSRWVQRKKGLHAMQAGAILVTTALSWLSATGLALLAKHYLQVSFLTAPRVVIHASANDVWLTVKGLALNTLDVFGANFAKSPYGLVTLRAVVDAVLLIMAVGFVSKNWQRLRKQKAFGLVVASLFANYAVYVASGQAMQSGSARYLVMVPLLMVMLVAITSDKGTKARKRQIQHRWLFVALVSVIMLLGALVVSWPQRHSKDTHIMQLVAYLEQHHYQYALGSREDGVTTTYFASGKATVLPMGCRSGKRLVPTNLFYDYDAFNGLYDYKGAVPVILSNDGIRFGNVTCSKQNIIAQFGIPKQEQTIPGVGTALVYEADRIQDVNLDEVIGHHRPRKFQIIPQLGFSAAQSLSASSLPVLQGCQAGTIDVFVAHSDDDLLFMNPAIADKLAAEHCIRTVYVTAADDGYPEAYWRGRERGIKAAYSAMLVAENNWQDSTASIGGNNFAVSSIADHPRVSLAFLRLPDGNVNGAGFASTGNVSLQELAANPSLSLTAVDGSATYTNANLVQLLSTIITVDRPTVVYTLITGGKYANGDHSDHLSVGRLTLQAAYIAGYRAPITSYVGYPSNNLLPNLSAAVSENKRELFQVYASEDGMICASPYYCAIEATYENYFSRTYPILVPVPSSAAAH